MFCVNQHFIKCVLEAALIFFEWVLKIGQFGTHERTRKLNMSIICSFRSTSHIHFLTHLSNLFHFFCFKLSHWLLRKSGYKWDSNWASSRFDNPMTYPSPRLYRLSSLLGTYSLTLTPDCPLYRAGEREVQQKWCTR